MGQGRLVASLPFVQGSNRRRGALPQNRESVVCPLHGGILSSGGRFCKVARTVKGKERFPFRITILPAERPEPKPPWVGTRGWKLRAIYLIKMKLSIQAEKASNRARWQWFKFYYVSGYGAPGSSEFICPYSGMVAKALSQEEAVFARRYWATCASKSREILRWLSELDPSRYSVDLHVYLLRTIVTTYNAREMEKYGRLNSFAAVEPWQEQ